MNSTMHNLIVLFPMGVCQSHVDMEYFHQAHERIHGGQASFAPFLPNGRYYGNSINILACLILSKYN